MGTWPALLLAPLLALTNLSVTYALVTPQCMRQTGTALHVAALLSLVLTLLFTWMAWQEWRRQVDTRPAEDAASRRPEFLSAMAMMAGVFSFLVILAQWIPQWVLSPCTV